MDYLTGVRDKLKTLNRTHGRARCVDWFERVSQTPWDWPVERLTQAEQQQFHRALPDVKPRDLLVGETLLVGVRGERGTLLRLADPFQCQNHRGAHVAEHHATYQSWREAKRAALMTVRYVLSHRVGQLPLYVVPISRSKTFQLDSLDGRSYKLAFALHHASVILNLPIPWHIVTSADMDTNGTLLRIDGLEQKIRAVAEQAKGVREFYVAKQQEEEGRQILKRLNLACPLEIKGFETLQEVMTTVWGSLGTHVAETLKDASNAQHLLHEFYENAFEGTDRYPTWAPIINTLELFPQHVQLTKEQEAMRQYTLSVALRHDGDSLRLQQCLPHFDALGNVEKRPQNREELVASYIQMANDSGVELPKALHTHAHDLSARLSHQEVLRQEELKTLCSYARDHVRSGRLEEAAQLAHAVAKGWYPYRYREIDQISHPLSVLYHIAGLLRSTSWFQKATQIEEELTGLLSPSSWTLAARYKARILAGEEEDLDRDFERLHRMDHIPPWKNMSNLRLAMKATYQSEDFLPSRNELQKMFDNIKRVDKDDRTIFSALIKLDHALFMNDQQKAEDAYKILLRTKEAPVFKYLYHHVPDGWDPYPWVADAYPN